MAVHQQTSRTRPAIALAWRYLLAWLPLVVLGILNGALRVGGYGSYFSDLRAHQISSVTAIGLFGIYIWWVARRWPFRSRQEAIAVGLLWVGLTVAFEFLFGRYVSGQPWRALLHDYNLLAGRIWSLVLLWIALAPYLFSRTSSR